jgi:hypothetical protein
MAVPIGRRMSVTGVVHLTEEKPNQQIWFTLCGRKICAAHALPSQEFAGENRCVHCAKVQRSSELLRSRLGVA